MKKEEGKGGGEGKKKKIDFCLRAWPRRMQKNDLSPTRFRRGNRNPRQFQRSPVVRNV